MGAFITLVIIIPICTGVFYFTLKALRSQATKAVGKERDQIRAEIDRFDAAIARAVGHLKDMVSLDEVTKLEQEHSVVTGELVQEQGKVKKLEQDLAELQAKVDKQEARHNELKKGKEDCDRIAVEIRANQEDVASSGKLLQSQVEESRSKISSLTADAAFSEEEREVLNRLSDALKNMATHLDSLIENHIQSTERFLNLQTQYSELEKEYRKLVDKELSGENNGE